MRIVKHSLIMVEDKLGGGDACLITVLGLFPRKVRSKTKDQMKQYSSETRESETYSRWQEIGPYVHSLRGHYPW